MTHAPRAVVFDLYDTLVRVDPGARAAHHAALAAELGLPLDDYERYWQATSDASNRGELRATSERFAAVARLAGVAGADAAALAAREHAFLAERTRVGDGAVELLDGLRASGIATALLSNCSSSVAATLATAGLAPHLDVVVLSCEIGAIKPEPAIYRVALDRLAVPAEEAVYVADGQHGELESAAELGMRAVRVTWSTDGGTSPAGAPVVGSLGELGELLGTLERVE